MTAHAFRARTPEGPAEVPLNRSILVVEDDAEIRESLQRALEAEGYPTRSAANGAEALRMLMSEGQPGLVFLDLMMPVMSGPELLARMRQEPRLAKVPVVIVSAWVHEAGALRDTQGVLKKPIPLASLLQTAQQYCGAASPDGPS